MTDTHREATSQLGGATRPPASKIVAFALGERDSDECRGDGDPEGTWHSPMWAFTRAVRSFFGEGIDPEDVFAEVVEPEIERRGGWRELFSDVNTAEDVYLEFVCTWGKVRYKIGETPLSVATARALAFPLQPAGHDRAPHYGEFVSLAGWLQVAMGVRPIMLPVEKVAALLDVTPMTATRYRYLAVKDGYLRVVREHSFGRHRATEFMFDVARYEILLEHAKAGTATEFVGASRA